MLFNSHSFDSGEPALRCVVAIPARDEAAHLQACLGALACQTEASGAPLRAGVFEVVLFCNNCADGTVALARAAAPSLPFLLHVVEEALAPAFANAGEARRRAMDLALARLDGRSAERPVILTTDADSRVCANWIEANIAAIDDGADAVLGRLALDQDAERLSEALHRRGALEAEYERLLAEMNAALDPQEWNPWPHHATVSGASIAITVEAYRAIGGLPRAPLGEDKALVEALVRHDQRVRYSSDIEVVTSARLQGRAAGGVADTLRLRMEQPDADCDEALEPYDVAELRAALRGRMRRLWRNERRDFSGWGDSLSLSPTATIDVETAGAFGAAWRRAEQASPKLRRRRLRPADLPAEIAAARTGLRRLRALSADAWLALTSVE